MTAPPGIEPDAVRTLGPKTGDAFKAYLAREALRTLREEGIETSRHDAVRIASEIAEAKRLDLADFRAGAHAEVMKHFRDAVREYARRHKLSACDQRIGGPNWRLSS